MPEAPPTSPEDVKAACPFCKIVKGEIPSKKVYEEDKLVAALDINPKSPGHTLLMPKEHYPILPVLPADVFCELFAAAKKLSVACSKAVDANFSNIFIANGAAAGQQSQHFMVHIIPNKVKGGFEIPLDGADTAQIQATCEMFSNNLPIMLQNHFQRNHSLKPTAAARSDPIPRYANTKAVYEDSVTLAVLGEGINGHTRVYAKGGAKSISDLPDEDIIHLFFVASFAATAAFEGLKVQGTNIIVNNSEDAFCIDVIPRREGDGLSFMWEPKPGNPEELEEIAEKIRNALGGAKEEKKPGEKAAEKKPESPPPPKRGPQKSPERDWQEFMLRHQDDVENLDDARNA
ncbi:MAG: HIT domain-containing protein [Candidatus Aenigmatarchaeota archaeon]